MKQVPTDDGGSLWVHEALANGLPLTVCVDSEVPDAQALLSDFAEMIPEIWPELYMTMQTGFEDYGHSEEFPPAHFLAGLGRMTADVFMGDASSYHLRFEFEVDKFSDHLSIYDFFLDDDFWVVHHQPVF